MTTIKTLAARVLCIFGLHEWTEGAAQEFAHRITGDTK
jgi:hypothetical protein